MIANASSSPVVGLEARWVPIHAFAVYQRMSAELFFRGRLRDRLTDPEPLLRLRNVSSEPLLSGVPRLTGVAEATLDRDFVGAIGLVEQEPPNPDAPLEVARHALFQGSGFTVTGLAQFPAGADAAQHLNLVTKAAFWPVAQARISLAGSDAAPWELPLAWVNRNLIFAIYLA